MATTRHTLNRRRRVTAAPAPPAAPAPASGPRARVAGPRERRPGRTAPASRPGADDRGGGSGRNPGRVRRSPGVRRLRPRLPLPVLLAALALLLGALATHAATQSAALRDAPAARNTALTDTALTSEVQGTVSQAVADVFSYDYTAPDETAAAARAVLTGRAVEQHRALLAPVTERGSEQQLVLTTTVTHSGVELIDGDRARVLLFADQRSTRTGEDGDTTYAAAMFAVDAAREGGTWRIAALDTFPR
ncbi:hypothetical protein WDH52_08495 [Streptomyces sp. TRM70308]|uniref:hypothetical protein n=1 Tax=Streptomyces sp. TRM70308 TaxID=3131932 RepID=UPI003D04B1DE